jgi:glycosyltransferase involved in cell wall biosynthesis
MYIIHLGYSGFPAGNATMKRILLTFKAIKAGGFTPLVINKHSIYSAESTKRINIYQGVPYINTSPILSRPDSFMLRNLNKIFGYICEFNLLLRKRDKVFAAIFYHSSIAELLYYRILSKIFRFKLINHYVEFRSEISERRRTISHFNDILFDKYSIKLCDGVIVISEYLKNYVKSLNSSLSILKIPAICNFDEFKDVLKIKNGEYMMFCSAIGYLPVIKFVIELFEKLKELDLYTGELLLVIGVVAKADQNAYLKLLETINKSEICDSIILKKNVRHDELVKLYLESELLIVPLRNNVRDVAGFHHKVGEYAASMKPIISTNIGELKFYFEDGVSAILADEYTVESYVEKLQQYLSAKEKLEYIAEAGYRIGIQKLNYLSYVTDLKKYLLEI